MPRQAQWALNYKKQMEEEVPQQYTVVKRFPKQSEGYGADSVSRETQGIVAAEPMSQPRYTGNGVDGTIQPGKMVDMQVEEGEIIIPANAAQNFTEEEIHALNNAAAKGTLDKNMFRKSVGMPEAMSFQTGGISPRTRDRLREVVPDPNTSVPIQRDSADPQTQVRPQTGSQSPSMQVPSFGQPQTVTVDPQTRQPPATGGTMILPPTTPPQTIDVSSQTREPAPTLPITPLEPVKPTEGQATTITPQTREQPDGDPMAPPAEYSAEALESARKMEAETPAQTAASQAGDQAVRESLNYFVEQMRGMSETDRKIANYYLTNFDAKNAADTRVLEHQISSDPHMSEQGKQTAIASMKRGMSAKRYGLAGELAKSSQMRADQGAQQAAALGQDVQRYEDITKPAAEQAMELDRRQFQEITLPGAVQNRDIARRTFEELTLPGGKIDIEQMKSNFNNQQWDDIQGMIDKGLGKERINEALSGMGLQSLSDAEYISMIDASAIGERQWGRQLSAANMLLQTPGTNNKEAAAIMYGNLFPGVDFDFSELVSMENAEIFGTGLSQMSSYVTADMNFDEALTAMQKDGTFGMLGMDDNQAAQLYNSLRVNAVDAEWKEFEGSEFYQSLTPEEQSEQKEFFKAKMLGSLDYDTLHEYNLYNQDGTVNKTIFAKDATEANKAAAKDGLIAEDTGRVQFRMASTIDTTPSTTTGAQVTPSLEGQGSDKPVGTKYIEDGRVYQVGAGGEIKELEIDPTVEQWGKPADDVLALGEKDNPYYNDIIESRARDIVGGAVKAGKVASEAVYDKMLTMVDEWNPAGTITKGTVFKINGKLFRAEEALAIDPANRNQDGYGKVTDLRTGKPENLFNSSEIRK